MKRVRITSSGKLKHKHAYMGHLAPRKTRKQRKHLRKYAYIHKSDMPRLTHSINWKMR